MKTLLKSLGKVFGNIGYLALAVVTALIFYLINVLITSYGELSSFFLVSGFLSTLRLFFEISFLTFWYTVRFHSFISLIIISILVGMLVSLITYKTITIKEKSEKRTSLIATIGIFLGILAPGCAACGIGIISALGLGAATITFLPFEGLEISALSIAILLFANWRISKDLLEPETCKIQLNVNKDERG